MKISLPRQIPREWLALVDYAPYFSGVIAPLFLDGPLGRGVMDVVEQLAQGGCDHGVKVGLAGNGTCRRHAGASGREL